MSGGAAPPPRAASGAFLGCGAPFEGSRIALFGAPFDGTSSFRPGSRFAWQAMRAASQDGIETYSPYADLDLSDFPGWFCDLGDIELPYGDAGAALARVEAFAGALLAAGKLPVMIGGEHLVTLGMARAAARACPQGLRVVCFDAHADLREEYLGVRLSHACVMRRCWELVGDGRLVQLGVRSGERAEFAFAREHCRMRRFGFEGIERLLAPAPQPPMPCPAAAPEAGPCPAGAPSAGPAGAPPPSPAPRGAAGGPPTYLSIDLDVLDPSELPGTGTPEAGGARFQELLDAASAVIRHCDVVALDMTELCPPCDPSGASAVLAAKLLRELLLRLAQGRARRAASPPFA